jgi:anti-sigma regulatory factor (Ser/Thr protein kinase)
MPSGTRRFSAEATSAAEARGYVRSLLADCDEQVTDAIVLMTSELVTNAIVHGQTAVVVALERTNGVCRVSVSDENHAWPKLRHPDPLDFSGRGLSIVDEVSDHWGVNRGSRGKTVWFTVAAKGSA